MFNLYHKGIIDSKNLTENAVLKGFLSITWKDPKDWTYMDYDGVHFFLVTCYFILFGVGIFMFVRYQYNSNFFIATFMTGTLLRLLFFALQPFVMEGILVVGNSINFMLNTFPSFCFFSAYMMLLFFWGEIYRTSDEKGLSDKIWRFFVVLNCLMYLTVVTLFILDLAINGVDTRSSKVPSPQTAYEQSVMIFAGIMYAAVSIGFFVYGYYTFRYGYYDNAGLPIKRSVERKKLLRKVGTITLVAMTCFLVRSAVTMWAVFDPDLDWWWWLDGVYYFFLEVIPVLLMLGAYVQPRVNRKRMSYKLSGGGGSTPDTTVNSPLITTDV